jgi:hypothetical protein
LFILKIHFMAKGKNTKDGLEFAPHIKIPPVDQSGNGNGGALDVNIVNDSLNMNVSNTPNAPLNVNVGNIPANINVTLTNVNPLKNTTPQIDNSVALGRVIQHRSEVFGFNAFKGLMDNIFRGIPIKPGSPFSNTATNPQHYLTDQDAANVLSRPLITMKGAYDLLKFATERYVSRVFDTSDNAIQFNPPNPASNSYIDLIVERINDFFKTSDTQGVASGIRLPILTELIWSYWHEEGMLEQTMIALTQRFQNKANTRNGKDPLANFATDPLRPLNNIIWGYIQDEMHRLTLQRRAYEYEHEYGLRLIGDAVKNMQPAERRSNFLSAFHDLLHKCCILFKEADDRTRTPDGFAVLNALLSLHMIMAEGAHNQFGDLPVTARVEMLMEQWILSQPEIREFLGGRIMVPYREAWMDRVDSMKNLQGWVAPSVTSYNDLARFGEQLLLHIRWTNWTDINLPDYATIWALEHRPAIQKYIHAYRMVTNVDLSADASELHLIKHHVQPSLLIQQKFEQEQGMLGWTR